MAPLCPRPVRGGVDLQSLLQPKARGLRAFYVDAARDLLVARPFDPESWTHWFWGLLEGCWFSRDELVAKGRLPVVDAPVVLDRLQASLTGYRAQLHTGLRPLRGMNPAQLVMDAKALVEDECGSHFRTDRADEVFKDEAETATRQAGLSTAGDVGAVVGRAKVIPQSGRAIGDLTRIDIQQAVALATAERLRLRNEPVIKEALDSVPYHGDPAQEDDLRARVSDRILQLPECCARLLTQDEASAVVARFVTRTHHMDMLQTRMRLDWNTAEFVYERAVVGKGQPLLVLTTEPTDAECASLLELLSEPGIDRFLTVEARWGASATTEPRRTLLTQSKAAVLPWLIQKERASGEGTPREQVKKRLEIYTTELPEYTARMYLALLRVHDNKRLSERQKSALSQQLTQLQLAPESLDAYLEAALTVQRLMHDSLSVLTQPLQARVYPEALLRQASDECRIAVSKEARQSGLSADEQARVAQIAALALLGLPERQARSLNHFPALFAEETARRAVAQPPPHEGSMQ